MMGVRAVFELDDNGLDQLAKIKVRKNKRIEKLKNTMIFHIKININKFYKKKF